MHPAQRDLGGADQAEVAVLDRIDLRFVPARREPDPLQDTITGQVGRDDGSESRVDQFSERELLECQVEEDGVVLEEVEAGPADLAGGLEIDQVEVLAQLDVVLGLEVELAGRADFADLAAVVLGQADRGVGMRQVGDSPQPLGHLGLEPAEPLFFVGDRRLERLPSSIKADRFCGSRSLPVAWATSFWRRRISSTAWSKPRRSPSSATARSTSSSTSGGAFRLRQFCLTASVLATTNFRSSMGIPFHCSSTAASDLAELARAIDSFASSPAGALALMPRWKSAIAELLVGAVQVIVVLAPAQEQRVDAQLLLDQARRPGSSPPRG